MSVPTTSEQLAQQQLEQAQKTGSMRRNPKPVKASARSGITYNAELQRMIRAIRSDINSQIVPLLRRSEPEYVADSVTDDVLALLQLIINKWSSPGVRQAGDLLARQFVTTADRINLDRMQRSLGVQIFQSPQLNDYLTLATTENVNLIRSISSQYLGQVESIVITNMRAGNRSTDIVKLLSRQFGVTSRRAKFIARDQTLKINGDLTKRRQIDAGFEYFQWMDSDDEKVRDRHTELANKVTAYGMGVYRWDNPPLSDSGQRITPGQDFQCRCNARPVSSREVEANVKAGRTRPGVLR